MPDPLVGLAAVLLVVLGLPLVLSIIAYNQSSRLGSRLAALKAVIDGLEARLAKAEGASRAPLSDPVEPPASEAVTPDAATPPVETPAVVEATPIPQAVPARPGIEEKLASRWLLWLGALALALSGLFLVSYAMENELLSPAMRVVAGLALGIGLVAAGEWLRRRPLQRLNAAVRADQVPGALVSAGLFVSFASVYGAYGLYGLISPLTAFAGLAVIALAAFALAAMHASIVAILGLLAGFATPALVSSREPSAAVLFSYLALIIAASLAVVRYRGWAWLAFGALAGGALWALAYIAFAMKVGDIVPLAGFLAFLTAACVHLALAETEDQAPDLWQDFRRVGPSQWCGWIAAVTSTLLSAAAVHRAGAGPLELLMLAVLFGAAALSGRRWQRFDGLFILANLAAILAFLSSPPGATLVAATEQVLGISGPPFEGLIATAVAGRVATIVGFALLSVVAGYVLLRNARRPQLWAAASAIGAALLLAIAYRQFRDVSATRLWAGIATTAAGLALLAATSLNSSRASHGRRLALGIYAAAVVAGVSFAFAFVFREAWLTVALALQLPALAWLEDKLDLKELRLFALVVASVVLVRLALNPYVFDYHHAQPLGAHWVLYGYGVPAAAFLAAAWMFRRRGADLAVTVLEAGALGFALLLAAFEVRIFVEGRIDAPSLTLLELSIHALVWLATGWWRGRAYAVSHRPLDGWYALVLIVLGAAASLPGALLFLNPALTGENVGDWPVINKLLLAYLIPAGLAVLISGDLAAIARMRALVLPTRVAGLVLALAWVTLETKRLFQGPIMSAWHQSDREYYAYSVVWLLSAFVLLGAGIGLKRETLRHAALAVLLLVVLKVFVFDMADLEGLYRVGSFLGLGLSLVVIGWLYQRFVFPAAALGPASPRPP